MHVMHREPNIIISVLYGLANTSNLQMCTSCLLGCYMVDVGFSDAKTTVFRLPTAHTTTSGLDRGKVFGV